MARFLDAVLRLEALQRRRELLIERRLEEARILHLIGRMPQHPGHGILLGQETELHHALSNQWNARIALADLDALPCRHRCFIAVSGLRLHLRERGLHCAIGGVSWRK